MASKPRLVYTGANRKAYAKGVMRIQDALVIKWRAVLYREFVRTNKELAESYALTRTSGFQDIKIAHQQRLEVIFRQMVTATGKVFVPMATTGVKSITTMLEEEAIEYALTRALLRVDGISAATLRIARMIIAAGIELGRSYSQIGKDLQGGASAVTSRSRGTTIARTEVHTAANVSANKMAVSSGVTLKREWIASSDDRTRDDHSEADGQVVAAEQEFSVGGESMMYPGDPSGSAANVINCRCVVAYIPPDGD